MAIQLQPWYNLENPMRYFIQITAMLTDLVIIAAIYLMVFYGGLGLFSLVLIGLTFMAWNDVGGPFFAWRPKNIRAFLKNW